GEAIAPPTGPDAATGNAAGAGEVSADTFVVELEPIFGVNDATAHDSDRGAYVMSVPFIPVTSRPLTVVDPDPRSVLSEETTRSNGPPVFRTWTNNAEAAFSTV